MVRIRAKAFNKSLWTVQGLSSSTTAGPGAQELPDRHSSTHSQRQLHCTSHQEVRADRHLKPTHTRHPKTFHSPHHEKTQTKHSHVVEEAQRDTKEHLENAKNHRHLHLKGIEEGQLIAGNIPDLWKTTPSQTPGKGKQEKENTPFKLNSMNQSGSMRLKKQVFKDVFVPRVSFEEMSRQVCSWEQSYSNWAHHWAAIKPVFMVPQRWRRKEAVSLTVRIW